VRNHPRGSAGAASTSLAIEQANGANEPNSMMQFMMMQMQMQRESQGQSRVQQNQQFRMMMLMMGPMRQAPMMQQSTSDHSSFANTRHSSSFPSDSYSSSSSAAHEDRGDY
jgi:hypothetical protein